MKKILFKSNVLAILSVGLLVAVFAAIGMSFTPVEEQEIVAEQAADSTTTRVVRKSHWTSGSGCNTKDNNNNDYAKITAVTSGNGRVTIKNTTNKGSLTSTQTKTTTSAANNSVEITWNCNKSTGGHTNTFEVTATPDNEGYVLDYWEITAPNSNTQKFQDNPHTYEMTIPHGNNGSSQSTEYENQNSPYSVSIKAYFKSVVIVKTADESIVFTPTSVSESYTKTVTFTMVNATDMADLNNGPSLAVVSGSGDWKIGNVVFNKAQQTMTVECIYNANRTTYKNADGNRTDIATVTLTSKDNYAATCTLKAIFPPVVIQSATAQNLSPVLPSTEYRGTAVFEVQYADIYDVSFGEQQGAGTWKILNSVYKVTDEAAGKGTVTVNYSYTTAADFAVRQNSNTLTLTLDGGAVSRSCAITANVPDVAVLSATADNLAPTLPNTEYRGTAVFEVQYAATYDVSFGEQQGAGTWKVLNSVYKVTDEAAGKGTVTVNYSYTTAADFAVRQNSNTLTLTLDGGAVSRSCAITANVPDAAVLSATAENLSPLLPSTEYRGTAVFEVQYAAAHAASFGEQQGAGTWKVLSSTYRITDAATGKGIVTVEYSYTTAVDYTARTNSNTLTLTLDGGASRSCSITANLPAIAVTLQSNDVLVITLPEQTQAGKVVFAVTYANGVADFVLPTATDSRWSITDMQYASLSPSSGTLTVNYTFDNGGVEGDWTTDLTLQTASGATCVATLRAIAEKGSDKDAAVTTPAGETTEYDWADALAAANSEEGCTLRLLRNVALETLAANQEIKRNMTLDLNGKTLSATLPNTNISRLLWLNTAGVTLTVKDGRSGGTLKAQGSVAGALYAVQVNKGNLIWESGNIEITNTTGTGNNWNHATGIYLANGTGLTMTGGTITSRHTLAAYAGGIYAEAGAEVTATGVTIDVQAHSNAYGIYANAAVSAEGVAAFAQLNLTDNTVTATTVTAAGAYGVYLNAVQKQITTGDYIGEYAAASKAVITGGKFTATAKTSTAYGIYAAAPVATAAGGAYAAGELTVTDAEIVARTLGTTTAYGIQGSGATTVERCHITAEAKTTTARGIFLQDKTAKITDCEITATGTTTVYGIYANASVLNGHTLYVDLTAENNTVTATATSTTANNDVYGMYLNAAASLPVSGVFAGNEYAAASKAVITGGTYTATAARNNAYAVYSVTCAISDFGGAEAYPVINITGGEFIAEAGTSSAGAVRNGGHLTINGGTFTSNAKGGSVYGIYTIGGKLKATGTTITATNSGTSADYAYGVYSAENTIKDYIGKTFASDVELNDVTMNVFSGRSWAFGVRMRESFMSLTQAKYDALSDANKAKYKDKYAFGEYVAMGNCVINGGSFDIRARVNYAFGMVQYDHNDAYYVLSPDGAVFTSAKLDIRDAHFTVRAETGNQAHGIKTQTPTWVDNSIVDVYGKTGTVRALWITNGNTTVRNSRLTATGGGAIYGIYTYANANLKNVGWKASGTLTLDNLTVTATAEGYTKTDGTPVTAVDGAYGISLASSAAVVQTGTHIGEEYACAYNAVITGGTYTATAARDNAYAVTSAVRAVSECGGAVAYPEITTNGGTFKAVTGIGKTARALNSGGKAIVNGGVFTAQAGASSAMGFLVSAGTLEATDAVLNISATTSGAYGVYLEANINTICAVPYATQATLNNLQATITAGTSGAYGVGAKAGVPLTQTDATFETWCKNTKKIMNTDGTLKDGYQDIYDIYNAGYKRGEFVDIVRNVTVNGGTYNVTAGTATAHGIIVPKTIVSPNKVFVRPELSVEGVNLQVKALNGSTAYGIQGGGPTTVDDCDIVVSATADAVRGICLLDGKATVTRSTISAEGGKATNSNSYVYGIYAEATCLNTNTTLNGFKHFVDLTSDGNTVTARGTGNYVYGLWLGTASTLVTSGTYFGTEAACASSAYINKGKYTAEAGIGSAYGISCTGHAVSPLGNAEAYADLSIYDATVSAKSETKNIAYALQTGANTVVDGGTYTALAGTTDARGFSVLAGKFTATGSKLDVTATGASAIGINASAGLNSYAAIPNATQLELNNLDVTVRNNTTGAYGILIAAGSNVNQTDATFKTLATTTYKWLVEIKDEDGNGTGEYEFAAGKEDLYNLYNKYYKRGEFVDIVRNVTVNGGTYNVTTTTSEANGVKMPIAPVISATGKKSAATALQMRDVAVKAKSGTATVRGIYTSGPTTIDRCTVDAEAATTVYGLYVYDGETLVTNSDIKATANGYNTSNGNTDVYGIYAYAEVNTAGWQYVANLQLDTTQVTATVPNGNNAYALWLTAAKRKATVNTYGNLDKEYAVAASAVIDGGVYKATAMGDPNGTPKTGQTAYAIGVSASVVQGTLSAAPVCTINSGKFWGEAKATFADVHPSAIKGNFLINDGYFRNKTNVTTYVRKGLAVLDLADTRAEYKEGYRYFLSDAAITGAYVCEVVGKEKYKTLEEALTYVNNNTGTYTIRMLQDYTLPAGNYVLPANATLLVPYKAEQPASSTAPVSPASGATRVIPSIYLQLTFAEGVNFVVKGKVEVSGQQWTGNPYCSVTGPHGYLYLEENARMDIESGAKLYAWGYISGEGLITVKDGAESYEFFQLPDFKGGSVTYALYNNKSKKVFMITNYAYQNIESAIIYQYGAHAYGTATVSMNESNTSLGNKCLIGKSTDSEALFKMQADKNAWIKKDYNSLTDRTEWIMYGGTELGGLNIKVPISFTSVTMNSADYVLPLSGNMTVKVESGTMTIPQDVYFMPGTEMSIAKEATLKITSGKTLYLVDTEDWKGYKYWEKPTGSYGPAVYDYYAPYSPTWIKPTTSPRSVFASNKTNLPSAKIFVSGTLELNGGYLCTSAAGANICSTDEAAGKVVFTTAASSKTLYHCDAGYGNGLNGDVEITEIPMTAARLRNADGSYTATAGTAKGKSYNYIDGEWQMQDEDGCLSIMRNSSGDHYYAQAGAIVEVVPHPSNHTYQSPDGRHSYIYTEKTVKDAGCEWWEVEQVTEGEYRANNPAYENYGVHYTYDNNKGYWTPLMVSVTWSINGTNTTADVPAHTSPVYVGPAPSKTGNVWTGWTAPDGTYYDRNAMLPIATTNITYTAVFEAHVNKYTIVFKNEDGKVIDAGLYAYGETPVCNIAPTKESTEQFVYSFDKWTPDVKAVTGSAEYTAQYTTATRYYTVTFANYDGTVLYTEDFAYGTVPAYRGSTPVRENNMAYSYTFKGWDKPFGPVRKDMLYTAQFTAKEREFGDMLDVVDWTTDGIVLLNMNGYTSPSAKADWIVTADGIDYSKTDRLSNRTLELSLQQDYVADDEVLILAKGTDGVVESRRRYKVPHVFDADAVLGAVAADYSSVLFVRAGKLTVTGDATVAAVYVAPGAELCINAGVTLAAGKLVLRTEAFASAVFTNNGTLLCDNVCYSRIVSDNSQAYPLALPFDADLSKVTFSNGKKASFGAHFGLLAFDTQQRADKGDLNGGNWVGVNPAETTKLNACQGYQLLSASGYWSEYRFPVTYTPDGADAALPVKVAEGTAHKGHWGWNAFCSPYTSRFVCLPVSPEEAVKICLPNTDNRTYRQEVAATLEPASLFFHQAVADGTLSFGAAAFAFVTAQLSVVARQMPAVVGSEQTQWIRLFCGNNTGMQDETTVYLHPDKFTMDYQTGYDVIKLSKQGTLPFVWSALPYGDMAFAALPDSVAERGIALAVFAPTVDEMYFSLEENNWLMRLEHLWLLDKEEQIQTDLLENDYSWLASEGVSRGRFFLYPVLRNAPDNNTGWNELHTDDFVAYAMGKTIVVEHLTTGRVLRCYDTTGQLITCLNTDAEQLSIEVPTDGMYFVQVDNGVKKVMVK